MLSSGVRIVCDLGEHIWMQIRCGGLVSGVKLGGYRGSTEPGRERNLTGLAYELIRIFKAYAQGPVIGGVVGSADLRGSSPSKAHIIVRVHIQGIEDVGCKRRHTDPVWCEPAPSLPRHEFPTAASDVPPKLAQAPGTRVGGYVEIGRVIAV